MTRASLLAAALSLAACAAPQRPAPAPAEVTLSFALDRDEDPAHALSVASRRLRARGLRSADVTATQGSLSLRVPATDAAATRDALTTTAWLRVRPVDERVDLTALLPGPLPAGVRAESEAVTLAAGLTLRATALIAGAEARDALAALAASMRVAGRALVVAPRGGEWQLLAVEDRAALHGGLVARCEAEAPDRVTLVFGEGAAAAREALGRNGFVRRGVFEVDGVPRLVGALATDPTLTFSRPDEVAALTARCADGMLRGAVTLQP